MRSLHFRPLSGDSGICLRPLGVLRGGASAKKRLDAVKGHVPDGWGFPPESAGDGHRTSTRMWLRTGIWALESPTLQAHCPAPRASQLSVESFQGAGVRWGCDDLETWRPGVQTEMSSLKGRGPGRGQTRKGPSIPPSQDAWPT